jgi:hypothetical protein
MEMHLHERAGTGTVYAWIDITNVYTRNLLKTGSLLEEIDRQKTKR